MAVSTLWSPAIGDVNLNTNTINFGQLSVGPSGDVVSAIKFYSPSLTPTVLTGTIEAQSQTFTVTGLAVGDVVVVNGPSMNSSLCPMVDARVSAANTLEIDFANLTAAANTPVAGIYHIIAFTIN